MNNPYFYLPIIFLFVACPFYEYGYYSAKVAQKKEIVSLQLDKATLEQEISTYKYMVDVLTKADMDVKGIK